MKISKKNVNCNSEIAPKSDYDEAIKHIREAIDELIKYDDDVAADAVANLSVILFDLSK